jgi:aryl-alcohol dehydrogenase-like predicted oxidoreductase
LELTLAQQPSNPLLSLEVPLGFGFMNASWGGAPTLVAGPAREEFKRALQHAMDAGVTLFDTADIYAPTWDTFGHNEVLLREAIEGWSGSPEAKTNLIVATKGGITRGTGEAWSKDASYAYLMHAVETSAARLGLSEIPLWQHHRLDFHLTLGEQLANLKKLNETAPIRHIGVSNYSAAQLRQALDEIGGPADGGIISVQNQLNTVYRQQLDVLEVCEEFSLAYLPWSPMKGIRPADVGSPAYEKFARVASEAGVSIFAVAQAWLRSLSPNIVPLPGVTKLGSIQDAISASQLRLTAEQIAALSDLPETQPLDAELVRDQPLAD